MGELAAWFETKRLLGSGEAEAQRGYLEAVLEGLRPAALKEWIENHAGYNGSEEPLEFDAEEIAEFLAGLDEIRGTPKSGEIEASKRALALEIEKRVHSLRKLNWTGDHTYGDGVDDALQMIASAAQDEVVPQLERFRCPSLKGPSGSTRCELQLPHGENHVFTDYTNGRMVTWTDKESQNPPVPYDEPTWPNGTGTNPDPINRPLSGCQATHASGMPCARPRGHADLHRTAKGGLWGGGV